MTRRFETLTVVVPVYNEAVTLRASVEKLMKAQLPLRLEILVVDDGSTDDGIDAIGDLREAGDLRVVRHETNRGKGAAVRTGIEEASGELLTIYDADSEYNPADFAALLAPLIEGDAEVVYGTRQFGAHNAYGFWYVIGNRVVALYASFLFNTWLTDIETCFKVAPTETWRSLDLRSSGFGIEAEVTARLLRNGHRIYELPISYKARSREEGKKLIWTDGVVALWVMTLIRITGRRTLFRSRALR